MSTSIECYYDIESQKELEVFEGIEWSVRNEYERKLEEEIQSYKEQHQVLSKRIEQLESEKKELAVQKGVSNPASSDSSSSLEHFQMNEDRKKLVEELRLMQKNHESDLRAIITLSEHIDSLSGNPTKHSLLPGESERTKHNALLVSI
ncbi:uncharacterized protein [Blastocystis hominis]|uniref:Uncharacterized protein n=1 Tax=Blastocystis hominis TaxID=12968 RepID=D8M8U4_BLAHO|nr:uncharacterized protein [Blastocystis hominis]CBK24483.2 unnamed protein product [Blastocystis hominis]|eukprot:XP_012898531.1 uncharacterized protein [Blastocystis hominis]